MPDLGADNGFRDGRRPREQCTVRHDGGTPDLATMARDEADMRGERSEIRPPRKGPGVNHQAVQHAVGADDRIDLRGEPVKIRGLQLAIGRDDDKALVANHLDAKHVFASGRPPRFTGGAGRRPVRILRRVLIKSQLVTAPRSMSALARYCCKTQQSEGRGTTAANSRRSCASVRCDRADFIHWSAGLASREFDPVYPPTQRYT